MSDYAVEGPELKKLLVLAKKASISFAFNPGKSDEDHLFALHRKRPPAMLGKALKKEGVGKKAAYGSCHVEGKKLYLTCDLFVPGMARKLQQWLRSQNAAFKVIVTQPDGAVLEGDDAPEADEAAPEPSGEIDVAALKLRVKSLVGSLGNLPDPHQSKMQVAVRKAVELLAAKDAGAEAFIERLEEAVARLSEGAAASQAPDGPVAPAHDARELAQRLKAVNAAAQSQPEDVSARMRKLISGIVPLLKSGDLERAAAGIEALEAIDGTTMDGTTATASGSMVAVRKFLISRWQTIPAEIDVQVNAIVTALTQKVPHEDGPAIGARLKAVLAERSERLFAEIRDGLDADINAGAATYPATHKSIAKLRGVLDGDDVLSVLAATSLMDGTNFATAFQSGLDELEQQLAA